MDFRLKGRRAVNGGFQPTNRSHVLPFGAFRSHMLECASWKMVLEELAALRLASFIVQFVNFTSKLVSNVNKRCKDKDGALAENAELQGIAENLQ